jgi:hypothetical protein
MQKSKLSEAADVAKSVASEALGAAAVAATQVVISKVASALKDGGEQLEQSSPKLQRIASDTVAQPLALAQRKPASKSKRKSPGNPRSKRQPKSSRSKR